MLPPVKSYRAMLPPVRPYRVMLPLVRSYMAMLPRVRPYGAMLPPVRVLQGQGHALPHEVLHLQTRAVSRQPKGHEL